MPAHPGAARAAAPGTPLGGGRGAPVRLPPRAGPRRAYGQLPRAARAERHRRAAHWLQGLAPDRAEDRAELAAHHWQAALQFARAAGQHTDGLAGPARQAYREAGDRAFALNALGAAARWYRAALELWPAADPERPRLLMRLARAAYWAEEPDAEGLAEALEEARDGLLAGGDRAAAAEAESLLSTIALLLRRGRRAEEHAWRAVALLEGTGPSPTAARVLNQRASLSIVRGRADEAIRVARQALAMAEPLGLDDERGQSLMTLGSGRFVRGDLGGLDDLEQAVAIHLATRSPRACDDYANLASLQIAAGDLARGFELQARAREVAERFGLTVNLRELRYERVSEDYWSGRWQAAVTALERLFAELATGAYSLGEPQGRIIRGWVRLAAGDPAGALDDLDTGLVASRAAGDVQFELPLAAVRALALLAAGDRERAGAQASELLSKLEGRKGCYSNPDWSGSLAVVLEALGRGRELLDLLAAVGGPTPWFEAAAAVAAGDFEAAADRYAAIGSRPDEAFARLLAAERLVVAGRRAEAEEQARNVLAFAGEAGAAGWLRRAEALLAASA